MATKSVQIDRVYEQSMLQMLQEYFATRRNEYSQVTVIRADSALAEARSMMENGIYAEEKLSEVAYWLGF